MISNSAVLTLFKELLTLYGEPGTREILTLAKGEHIFPFSFRVPGCILPPTYTSTSMTPSGCVRYEVNASLSRPEKQILTTSFELTVPSTLDSRDPEFLLPEILYDHMSIGRNLFSDGHVEVQLKLPQKAYSSGEYIPV